MPQAPDALRELFVDDSQAWEALGSNFTDDRGVIRPKPGHEVTVGEAAALDYLVLEWDYAFEHNSSDAGGVTVSDNKTIHQTDADDTKGKENVQ